MLRHYATRVLPRVQGSERHLFFAIAVLMVPMRQY